MRRNLLVLGIAVLLALTGTSAFAQDAGRYQEDLDEIIDYWIDWAEDEGYDVLDNTIDELYDNESAYYDVLLSEGTYHLYAEAVNDTDDIDLYVWDADEEEIVSDTMDDYYPLVEFTLRRDEWITIEVLPYEYGRGNSTWYGMVLATEDGGEILEIDDGADGRTATGDEEDLEYVEDLMDQFMDDVADEGYEMIFDSIDIVNWDEIFTYTITLGRGYYTVYAEGGLNIADLDMRVYNDRGRLVVEDTFDDNYPICEFEVDRSSTFEIEVEPYEMASNADAGYFLIFIVRE